MMECCNIQVRGETGKEVSDAYRQPISRLRENPDLIGEQRRNPISVISSYVQKTVTSSSYRVLVVKPWMIQSNVPNRESNK